MSTSLTHCRNCGHRLYAWDKFCSQCGQDTLDHPPTLWEFLHEWVLHYLAFEGKLWRSLWGLIAKPGFLTLEYLAGRKQRYVLPLRLVLTLGLLFFVAIKLLPPQQNPIVVTSPQEKQQMQRAFGASRPASGAVAAEPAKDNFELGDLEQDLPDAIKKAIQQTRERFNRDEAAEWRRIGNKMLAMAPYAVLLSLPFFAGLLKLLYWRLAYGAHFVFAMHLHAAWYLMLLLLTLLPWEPGVAAIWFWSNLYPLLALKRVHRAGWLSTLARATLLVVMHWMLIGLTVSLLLLFGALSA